MQFKDFKTTVSSRYRIHSYHDQLLKMTEDAESDLAAAEDELKKIRAEYAKLVADESATLEQLLEVEKKLDEAEAEREQADKQYEKARHTTIQDLKDEHAYETWKGKR